MRQLEKFFLYWISSTTLLVVNSNFSKMLRFMSRLRFMSTLWKMISGSEKIPIFTHKRKFYLKKHHQPKLKSNMRNSVYRKSLILEIYARASPYIFIKGLERNWSYKKWSEHWSLKDTGEIYKENLFPDVIVSKRFGTKYRNQAKLDSIKALVMGFV